MFFHISKTPQSNFPYNYHSKELVVSLDEGWSHAVDQHNNDIYFKGYLDAGKLSDMAVSISQEEEPTHDGNFCVIKIFDKGAVVRSSKLRSFPLWYSSKNGLTNLSDIGETFWADSNVLLQNDLSIIHSKYDAIGEIETSPLTLTEVLDQIDDILIEKTKTFVKDLDNPIRVFLSGGIDTSTVFSYIQKYAKEYELVPYSHCDFDYFYLKNHSTLSKLWGYNQIHFWKNPCVLASGAPGDEFTVRSPVTANLMLLHYGTSIPELLSNDKFKNCLHLDYFKKSDYQIMWQNQQKNYSHMSLRDTIYQCCEHNINDWQHWHLGNTLTWTPLRDLRIFKLIARLSVEDLKEQIMNSVVQIELIKRNDPNLLNYLSDQKNSKNSLANLTRLYCK